jgi:hypothetical protein
VEIGDSRFTMSDGDLYVIRNQTPTRLEIRGKITLKLAPLQQIRVAYPPEERLGDAALHARTDWAVAWEEEPVRDTRVWATAWLTLFALGAMVVTVAALLTSPRSWILALCATVVALLCMVTAIALNRGVNAANGWSFTKDVGLAAIRKMALVIVLAVGVLAPTAAIYYGTELTSIIGIDNWRGLTLLADETSYPIIVAHVLQIILVVILALIPGLMYFQFDREKLTTLMDRWLHNAFRLDSTLRTVSDVDAKYGRRVEEFYGVRLGTTAATATTRTVSRSPLYVATVLLAIGWVIVLLKSPQDLVVQNGAVVPEWDTSKALPSIQRFIAPDFRPITCAFLGAYFFTVQLVLRGYVRGDLRPKTYNVVTVRIITAVILAWMLEALFGSQPKWVLATAFLAGVVPETVLRRIRDFSAQGGRHLLGLARRRESNEPRPDDRGADAANPGKDPSPHVTEVPDEFADLSPLTALDGIDIYERTRLAEEGITSIQALARHDLIDLMLSSRISASRLVDWIDQALLYQHVDQIDRRRLHKAGIRTATELITAYQSSRQLLASQLEDGESRLPLIVASLRDDEWLTTVSHWRSYDGLREPGTTIYDRNGYQEYVSTVSQGNNS